MATLTETTETTERLSWENAVRRMDWRPGEHVTLIGPTGAGKTELTIRLIELRRWVLFLGTKRIDPTQDRLRRMRFRVIADPAELNPEIDSRFILKPPWPRRANASQVKELHARIFREGLNRAFHQTGWTVVVDEGRYVAHRLGLSSELELFWMQGRSQSNTLVLGTQRPRYIPLEAYDQASHLFLWRDNDTANISRVAEMAGINRRSVTDIVPRLRRHDVLYVQPFTGDMFITNTRWER
jgi:hypothetical protein